MSLHILFNVLLFPDAILYNHPQSNVAEIHSIMGKYLRMAPNRKGGAGAGACIMDITVQVAEKDNDDDAAVDIEPDD